MPLTIKIKGREWFDNYTQEFHYTKDATLVLEHSLISISKWEAKWQKPYIDTPDKTNDELFDYIRCMSIKGEPDMETVYAITREDYVKIIEYIDNPMSATTISNMGDKPKSMNYTTSELLYAYMAQYGIDISCEKWHLNRLIKLIAVCGELNKPPKKRSESELIREYAKRNAAYKAKHAKRK